MRSVRAGNLNKRVVVLQRQRTQDASGAMAHVWTEIGTYWCLQRSVKSSEQDADGIRAANTDIEVETRVRAIRAAHRIQIDSQRYEVLTEPVDVEGRGRRFIVQARRLSAEDEG